MPIVLNSSLCAGLPARRTDTRAPSRAPVTLPPGAALFHHLLNSKPHHEGFNCGACISVAPEVSGKLVRQGGYRIALR